MLNIDPVTLSETWPRFHLIARRARTALTGRLYYFNGQKKRAQVFDALTREITFQNFVETGTFLGMTTDFLSRTARACGAQVYSCELDDRLYAISWFAVGKRPNVHLHHGNCVDFLRSLSPRLTGATNFVYLDAHWYDYLPLRDELSIVKDWKNSVVMIDDFKVPWDKRFGWDKYDDDREICLEHIQGALGANAVYFPAYPATDEEPPTARGYCVIAMSEPLRRVLDRIPLLRTHAGSEVGAGVRHQLV